MANTVDGAVPSWGGILIVYPITSERPFNFRGWHPLRVGSGSFCSCETLPSCVDEWCVRWPLYPLAAPLPSDLR